MTEAGPQEIDPTILVTAIQQWNQGQQEPAKALIQPIADAGSAAASAVFVWFLHQQGVEGWRTAIPYARRAIVGGYPQVAGFLIGNMINQPDLRQEAVELARLAYPVGPQYVDPIGQAVNLAQQGDGAAAVQMLGATMPGPPAPLTNEFGPILSSKPRDPSVP